MAYTLNFNNQKVKFALEHVWRELRHDQKWCSSHTSKGTDSSKRTKRDEGGAYSSSSNKTSPVEAEESPRPPGVKTSKGKAKKRVQSKDNEASSMLKFERMWEIKKKDIDGRERLSKQRLLDSLIAKTNLFEPELNLKNKLISDMLGFNP